MLVGVAFLPPSLLSALWNIGILLHKQAKRRTIMHTTVHTTQLAVTVTHYLGDLDLKVFSTIYAYYYFSAFGTQLA